ncbi:MAG: hypothetical protein JSW39_20745 [Desulfobacterales bacterium]|nr:MAG: hypothetical protein JSW39_20745 [Desulfobacterales bacterium]
MQYLVPKTKCLMCEGEFTKQGLTRHIKSCLTARLSDKSRAKSKQFYYFNVSDLFNSNYFLHLLIAEDATLEYFDAFLRNIWLECCGHLSAFSHQRFGDEISMKRKIKEVFAPDTKLMYQYDFGSTTELSVKNIAIFDGTIEGGKKISLLARNAQPQFPCDECRQKPAVQICTECQWDDRGWLCEDCAQNHACGDEMFLPVVNSPRTGVCGYAGPE